MALIWAGFTLAWLSVYVTYFNRERFRDSDIYATYGWACYISAVGSFIAFEVDWWTPVNIAIGTFFMWLWWKNRRKGQGKRAMKTLGAKSRAKIEVMARQLTPSPIPSPVRR